MCKNVIGSIYSVCQAITRNQNQSHNSPFEGLRIETPRYQSTIVFRYVGMLQHEGSLFHERGDGMRLFGKSAPKPEAPNKPITTQVRAPIPPCIVCGASEPYLLESRALCCVRYLRTWFAS
jgi:hypothetical protein